MKKMLAACAALMVVGFVSADITSDNIVGYTKKTSTSGYNWFAPMFQDVGADTISLKSITISDGGAGGIGWGGEILQTLDAGGAVIGEYYYYDPLADVNGQQTDYWWGDAAYQAVDVAISVADGFGLYTSSEDLTFTTAGEVPSKGVTIKSVAGYNFTGNFYPAPLPLTNITISDGGAGGIGWGGEIIQTLDAGGAVIGEYYYYDPLADMNGQQTDYWWGDASYGAVSASLNPGDGVGLFTSAADLDITFTPPY